MNTEKRKITFTETSEDQWVVQIDPDGVVGRGETAEAALSSIQNEKIKTLNTFTELQPHQPIPPEVIESLQKAHVDRTLEVVEEVNSGPVFLLSPPTPPSLTTQLTTRLRDIMSMIGMRIEKEVMTFVKRQDNKDAAIDPDAPLFSGGPIMSVDMGDESIDNVLYGAVEADDESESQNET